MDLLVPGQIPAIWLVGNSLKEMDEMEFLSEVTNWGKTSVAMLVRGISVDGKGGPSRGLYHSLRELMYFRALVKWNKSKELQMFFFPKLD